ncbi:carbohydrate ABC transporter permease [Microbacterium oryzae]|uniref:carbohydrate ABC transporter permease n=1 Tax=Microbacterium oryzae TaxID=743009 RepID=UPI003F5419B7
MTTGSPVVPVKPPGRTQMRAARHARGRWTGWGFLAPFMIVFALVFLAPIVYSIYLSLFRSQLVGGTAFVGFDNYLRAFGDGAFWQGLGRVVLFLAIQVPIMLAISLIAALAIDSGRLYGRNFFRIAIFLPYAVPAVVASFMWGFMYGNRFGLVRNLEDFLGIQLPDLLSPDLILASIGNVVTWEFVGYNMLIFYSALRVVPTSLYEAAAIDGASQFRIIRAIKIPAIRGSLVVATIFSIIGSFQLFNEPSIMSSLAPNAITTSFTPNLYAYNLAFAGQQLNYSATVAIIMGLITMVIAYVVQLRGMRKAD